MYHDYQNGPHLFAHTGYIRLADGPRLAVLVSESGEESRVDPCELGRKYRRRPLTDAMAHISGVLDAMELDPSDVVVVSYEPSTAYQAGIMRVQVRYEGWADVAGMLDDVYSAEVPDGFSVKHRGTIKGIRFESYSTRAAAVAS